MVATFTMQFLNGGDSYYFPCLILCFLFYVIISCFKMNNFIFCN